LIIYDQLIERLLSEDVPYGDITTEAMGIANVSGIMEFRARFDCVLGGVSEAFAVLKKAGTEPEIIYNSGSKVKAGTLFMTAKGTAGQLHTGWKVAQNIMEYASGIATRTREIVDNAKKGNPAVVVACTRKSLPGAKTICMNAVEAGGAVPHRLGLSETFLMFENHSVFFEKESDAYAALEKACSKLPEKKPAVEADSLDAALRAAKAGAGNIQFDKVKPETLKEWIKLIKAEYPHIIIAAAGGVNASNAEEYALTGIDVAVTSSVYWGKPADIEVVMRPL